MNTTALISPAIKFRIYELNSTKNLGVLVFFSVRQLQNNKSMTT